MPCITGSDTALMFDDLEEGNKPTKEGIQKMELSVVKELIMSLRTDAVTIQRGGLTKFCDRCSFPECS